MQQVFTNQNQVFRKYFFLMLVTLSMLSAGKAQISITSRPAAYSNNFNSYNPTSAATFVSTINTTATGSGLAAATGGWTTSASNYGGQGTGAATAGAIYGFGSSGNFSLGALRSGGTGNISYTVSFVNNTGAVLTALTFAWDYRQFRFANTSGWDVIGTGALASNTTLSAKDFTGAGSGTASVTTAVPSFTLSSLSIANGAAFGITWTTTDVSGSDNGVSIDNFSMSVPAPPTITPATNVFTAFTTIYGAASTAKTVSITGSGLTATITATAAAAFEVSSNGTTYGSTASFTQSGGAASGTLSIRLKANAAAGNYNSTTAVTLASTGAASRTYTTAATGNTVSARDLTITGLTANDKTYDGLTAVSITGTAAYSGLQNAESFSVSGTPVANFNTPNVGVNKTITVTGYTPPNGNYTLTQPTLTADITAAPLTVTGITVNDKIFDGNTSATINGTAAYDGLQNGESFAVNGSPVAAFTDAAIGNNKTVIITGYGAPNSNYTVTQPTGLTANITGVSIANADFRTKESANFSDISTWEYYRGDSWVDATQIPTSMNNVLVLHDVVLDQNFTVGSNKTFTILAGGFFTVDAGKTFDIAATGAADFGGQPVIFKSTSTGTASLGKVSGSITGATNVTVERYIPDNTFRSWRLLSVPTHGNAQTIRQAWQEGNANPNPLDNNLPGYGTQITGPGTLSTLPTSGLDNVAPYSSLQKWNGTGWTDLSGTNTPIAAEKAYFLYIRGDRSRGTSSQINNASATTLRTTGTIYTGDQTAPLIAENSFGLVPNLYPSAIDFLKINKSSNLSTLFYVWDSKKQFNNSLGVYQVFDEDLDYKCLIPGGSYSANVTNTTIESGQAFFVMNSGSGNGSVTITEDSKISSGNGHLGLRPANDPGSIGKFFTRLYSGNNIVDANAVKFNDNYIAGVDGHDALKFANNEENLAIQRNSISFVIEARPRITSADTIFFRMWNMQPKTYKLEFEASSMNMPGLVALLEDNFLHTSTPVNLADVSAINFTVTNNAASAASDRFRIIFIPGVVLPVNFINVTAATATNGINVNWTVANEQNTSRYDVERSLNGYDFIKVGQVQALNLTSQLSYNFIDLSAQSNTVFYRIRCVQLSGATKLSAVVKVSNTKDGNYVVSPNPIRNSLVNLQINNQLKGRYTIRIVNSAGQIQLTKTVDHHAGNNTYGIRLPSGFAKGIYYAEIISPNNETSTIKLQVD